MVRLTDRPDMTLDVYRGRKTTIQHNTTLLDVTTCPTNEWKAITLVSSGVLRIATDWTNYQFLT